MKPKLIVYWCRRDFRLHDNPALYHAIEKSKKQKISLLPLFVLEDYMIGNNPHFQFGYPSRLFLSYALPAFSSNFKNFTLLQGKAAQTIIALSQEYDIELFVNEDIHPDFYKQIRKLNRAGLQAHIFPDQLSIDKETKSKNDTLYSIFTPFKNTVWENFLSREETPYSRPRNAHITPISLDHSLKTLTCDFFTLSEFFSKERTILISKSIIDLNKYTTKPNLSGWYFTETDALQRFDFFLERGLSNYSILRNSLDLDKEGEHATSRMSLALSWGLVSARTLKNRILEFYKISLVNKYILDTHLGAKTYITELIWREFYKYLLFHKPNLLHTEFQSKFQNIQWLDGSKNEEYFTLWLQGNTGYPIVDAAMNQLIHSGWMHNRARMITASILTKNLGIDWRWGQEYFRATLIDLDEASNNGGWQWGASVGADPKPIRIFNPYIQASKFDPSGEYQKKWLPKDHTAFPLIEHKEARERAMNLYKLKQPQK